MTGDYDVGAPTLQVSVYEHGRLVARVPCESADDAADVCAQWEEHEGFECVVDDLAARHGPEDVLAPEDEDVAADDEYRGGT